MPQPMAGTAKGHQVIRFIAPSPYARLDVMHFQKPGPTATGGLATVLIPCKYLPAHAGRDRGRVSAAVSANGGIAVYPF